MREFFDLLSFFYSVQSAVRKYLIEHTEMKEKFNKLCDLIVKKKYMSETMLQRELKIDYYEAREIVKNLEKYGIVTPFDGIKPRRIIWRRFEELNSFFKEFESSNLK